MLSINMYTCSLKCKRYEINENKNYSYDLSGKIITVNICENH